MTSPFDQPPLPVAPVVEHPIAIVAATQEQVDLYLAGSRPPGEYVVVFGPEDVPARLGGMAVLYDGPVPEELVQALVAALGISAPTDA